MSDITYEVDKTLADEVLVERKPPAPRSHKPRAKKARTTTVTGKQLDVLTRYADTLFRTGYPIAHRPLAISIGVTTTAAGKHATALRKKGFLAKNKAGIDTVTPAGWNLLRRFKWRAPSPDKWCVFAVVVGLVQRGEIAHEVPVVDVDPDSIDAP